MSMTAYKKKIEEYIKNKESAKPKDTEVSKGLLAPKSPMGSGSPMDGKDPVVSIGEFVYALRQKRMEFKQTKNKGVK